MDHVTFIPEGGAASLHLRGANPVMRIRPGTVLTLWTKDAYGGRITIPDDIASIALDTNDLNPQTGPFSSRSRTRRHARRPPRRPHPGADVGRVDADTVSAGWPAFRSARRFSDRCRSAPTSTTTTPAPEH